MTFIQKSSKSKKVDDQIHVIWYVFIAFLDVVQVTTDNTLRFCFEPDVSRPLLPLEVKFFNEDRAWNGKLIWI